MDAELVLLRSFYSAWTTLHSLPRDILHRRQQEGAAQEMVDIHASLKNFYAAHAKPKLELVPSDTVDAIATDFDKAAERREHLGFVEKVNG